MLDPEYTKAPDGLEFNSAGYVRSPKPGDSPWGLLSLAVAFLSPFLVLWSHWSAPMPAVLLKKTALFRIAVDRQLLSEKQVENAEFLFVCLFLLIIIGIPPYFKKHIEKYSYQRPPPARLRKLWLPQILGMILIGAGFICAPVILADFVYWGAPSDIIAPKKSMFAALFLLFIGIYFAAEGFVCGMLYVYFYFKYWRSSD
jgi:hypothetical protein